jgi:hypothetical protein
VVGVDVTKLAKMIWCDFNATGKPLFGGGLDLGYSKVPARERKLFLSLSCRSYGFWINELAEMCLSRRDYGEFLCF